MKVKVPNKKKAEIKYKPRNNNHKNSYYGPAMNSKANFPRRNSRDEFGRMPRKKKEGNKSRGGPKKNAGQDHQVQASLEGDASSSQAFKQQEVEKVKWEPPAPAQPKQQSCLHYENDGAIWRLSLLGDSRSFDMCVERVIAATDIVDILYI